MIQVRGGNESVIGDQFVAYPTQYSNANILINGMNPTSGSAADRLTVVSDGTTTRFQATGTVFGPPQTRVVQSNDGASLGYFNIETTNIFDLTAPPGSPPGTPGNGTTVPSNGYYTVTSDSGAPAQVLVYDRLTDALRFTLNPFDGFFGGVRAAVGDVTGDGTPDIVVAAGPGANPHVKVFDGVTGEEIRSFFAYGPFLGGVEVAVGDLDGDGYAEIITGSGPQTRAHIKVFDGVTFAERESYFTFNESPDGFLGGIRVAVGDINGDGVLDIAVAAQAGAQSRLTVYDGRNLKANDGSNFLLNYFAFGDPITGAGFTGGVFLAVGDVNGDGFADVIAGAGQGGEPAVRVTSGRTGGIIHSFNANDSAGDATSTVPFEGGVRVAAVDFDNDGLDDILTAKGPGTSPFLRFFRFGDLNPAKIIRVNTPVFNGNYAQGIYVGG